MSALKENDKRNKRPSYRLGLPLALLLVVIFLLAVQAMAGREKPIQETSRQTGQSVPSSTFSKTSKAVPTVPLTPTPTPLPTPTPTPTPVPDITLMAVGDVILHQSVIDGGLVKKDGPAAYDYRPAFAYIKPIIGTADLALANYEGTLNGPPYTGYPMFCAPDEIADALYDTGFRVAWTSNNHTLDRGLSGVVRTAEVFTNRGFAVVGTRADEASRKDAVLDVAGYKIGLLAFTYETTAGAKQKTLNGIPMPAAAEPLIDSFNPYDQAAFSRDIAHILARAESLREEGAELICLALHWGNEYQTKSSSYQRQMAQQLADGGIELIIGHHPHVLQEIDVLESADGASRTLVFYSLGNVLHNMEFNTHGTKGFATDAMIAKIRLSRQSDKVFVAAAEYIPTYVTRVRQGSGYQHLIVPVLPALEDPAAFQSDKKELAASLERTRSVLAGSTGSREIPVKESSSGEG